MALEAKCWFPLVSLVPSALFKITINIKKSKQLAKKLSPITPSRKGRRQVPLAAISTLGLQDALTVLAKVILWCKVQKNWGRGAQEPTLAEGDGSGG